MPSLAACVAAVWLGVLAAMHPCPMANNVAAVSYIGRGLASMRRVLLLGLMYTLGRMTVFLALGLLVAGGLLGLETTAVAHALEYYGNRLLGPVLLFGGMVTAGLIRLDFLSRRPDPKRLERLGKGTLWGAFLLGAAFALSFCPTPAAYFFVMLVTVAVEQHSNLVVPAGFFAIGGSLPVLVMAIVLAFCAQRVGQVFNKLAAVEKWARLATGTIFIVLGVYYCLTLIFGVRVF